MSSEIIPFEKDSTYSSTTDIATSSRKETQHQHSSDICGIQPRDLLDPRAAFSRKLSFDLIGGDYHTKQYLASEKGHKYVKLFNPTLSSVKSLLDNMKEPSVLLLRGCDILLQSPGFPFHKFKSITTLEISGCRHLTTLPKNTISQMTQLQSLDLSYLQINHLPNDLFDNKEASLRSLVIRGCSNLHVLPEPTHPLNMLEDLDLSHLPIKTLPDGFSLDRLRSLILRGSSNLQALQLKLSYQLHLLDLCNCTSLTAKNMHIFDTPLAIDLSYTAFSWCNLPAHAAISHLFFRNANLCNLEKSFPFMDNIKVCDLSGNQGLGDVSKLERCRGLEALILSETGIESLDFLSELTYLRTLVLKDCTRLKQLPTVEQLENLQVLDLSGCETLCYLPQGLSKQRGLKELNLCGCKSLTELVEGLFDDMLFLEKIDLSNTNIKNLPSFANLIKRGTVIKQSCDSVLGSSSTVPTELFSSMNLCSDNVDSQHELHLVSTFISHSGFDKFKYKFTELDHYISFLEEKFTRGVVENEAHSIKMQFESMRGGLEYILSKVDLLESSQNSRSSEELLHQLMSYDYDNYDDDDSSILKKLLRTVAKLKLLVPPLPPKPLSVDKGMKKLKQSSMKKSGDKMGNHLHALYESLTTIQRNCLLYFVCLQVNISGDKMIKESILIHLWYGEGFFDPLLYANSTSNLISETHCGILHRNDDNQQESTSNANNTIGKIGRDILHVLQGKKLIHFDKWKRKWYIEEIESSFVITKAMEEHLFNLNKRGKLTPHFGVSTRACLLQSDIDHRPSSRVWLNYSKSSEQLERFKTVRTLLYINEPIVDINLKWFHSMTNLQVLHLVNMYSEQQINIVDLKFLEELKNMKQLRLLNLESFAIIQKLPDSICELTNLRILNLAYCSNLMELPAGIASLTNLIILDLTQCHLLSELPKGLSLLSELEVLKGFPITYEADGRQSKKACTLKKLLKLKKLRKLNLVVNKASFPDDNRDLQVLRSMRGLCNLKITWYPSIYKETYLGDAVFKGSFRQSLRDVVDKRTPQSRWKQLKCWGAHNEIEEEDDELLVTNGSFEFMQKLVLYCCPLQTFPKWLNPIELQNLEKLYIVGGNLMSLSTGFTNRSTWNIQSLKLKYLPNLQINESMWSNFPCLRNHEVYGCSSIDGGRFRPHQKKIDDFDIWPVPTPNLEI